jgi:two-component system response regulator QseB
MRRTAEIAMSKLLIVEDDQDLLVLIRDLMKREGHIVDLARNGTEAEAALKIYVYDLVILDWMLPDVAGIDVCKQYRVKGGLANILMLTGKKTVEDKEAGLDAGADDYLTKPFHPKELSARVRALLRRPKQISGAQITIGNLKLDTRTSQVSRNGENITLVPKEFSLLEFLARHKNQSFTAEAILERVWGSDSAASIDTVRTHIKTLRRKIDGESPNSMIRTVRGQGYKIEAQ